ncbi:5-carboxymethyl-2-hydroxymuconate Delta-isomerase [uncultured Paraglaciecola sp.]|uniref:5-carboxymethyl-2-hydroxymuconate Delta-isomerase n=1 Tax=uncultured Paraglaciecola sp. TaxID=1765024 RepID=UPI002635FD81|nr:5-carboxymethyl-2-hydroxymuconate Delta-isomerase [uncultured Paraglaciecola sp.]
MPHCIVEYSKVVEDKLPIKTLISSLHQSVFESGLFEESSIKTRALAYTDYQTGVSDTAFIHITLKILQGRNHQQKRALTRLVMDKLSVVVTSPISLSIEVMDIEKISYKWVML